MKTASLRALSAALFTSLCLAAPASSLAGPAENMALVEKAMHELFVSRDLTAVSRYWQDPYVQHNSLVPDGVAALSALVAGLPPAFRYEPGMITAAGDLVMLHGRYTGFGPKPLTTVDIFRIRNGRIVEHWDVMQDDVPASASRNGHPMFDPNESSGRSSAGSSPPAG